MANHAALSASSSHRWMNCPPSVRLTEHIADHSSVYAAEGSEAHELCEYKLRQLLGMEARNPLDRPGGLQYYDSTMEDAANGYAAFVLELLEEIKRTCPDPIVMVEQRLNFSRWVKDGFGTGDAVIVADGILQVVDFKYGTGVPVSAEGNSQMRLYALGALDMFGELYDVETVEVTIYQPRLSNISTDTISKADLLDWAENTQSPEVEQDPDGETAIRIGLWSDGSCRDIRVRATWSAGDYAIGTSESMAMDLPMGRHALYVRVPLEMLSGGEYALGIFNTSDKERTVYCPLTDVGLCKNSGFGMILTDVFTGDESAVRTVDVPVTVPAHDCCVFRIRLIRL